MLRRLACLLCLACAALGARAADTGAAEAAPLPPRYDRVEIGEAKTSIYIGSVTMVIPVLTRKGAIFESTYHARVFPYFFENESGRLYIEVGEAMLREVAQGKSIDFTGRAVRDDGVVRVVKGHAAPADAFSGRLKISVFISKRIQLIFHPTYRFVGPDAASPDARP